MLVCTFICHCYRQFASYGQPFICYLSVASFIPLSSFAWMSKGIWKVFLGCVILFVPRDSCPIIFIMGRIFRQMSAMLIFCVVRMCVPFLCFPCIDFVSFLSKETPHILLLLHCVLNLESENQRKLLHLLYGKTLFTSRFR